MPDATAPGEAPALGISFKVLTAQNQELVFQTHVAADIAPKDLNVLLDRLARAADRQRAYYELEGLREGRARQYSGVMRSVQQMGQVDALHEHAAQEKDASGRRKPYAIPPKEVEARKALEIQLQAGKDEVERFDAEIAKREALLKE